MGTKAATYPIFFAAEHDNLRYLYSCFTKIPSLLLGHDRHSKPVAGYEEFPFDTAVPLFVFKNLGVLEIRNIDFRQFCGWDRVAEQLRSLTVKNGSVVDIADLLVAIVLDDADKRRRRSSKQQQSISSPLTPGSSHSPSFRHSQVGFFSSEFATSPLLEPRRPSIDSSTALTTVRSDSSMSRRDKSYHQAHRSSVPSSPVQEAKRPGLSQVYGTNDGPRLRRASGSDDSSVRSTPRNSSNTLPLTVMLSPNKWRFLRHLGLPDNALTQLSSVGLAPLADSLRSLDLSQNDFEEIPESISILTNLQALNMSCCQISTLRSLKRFSLPALTIVNLHSNQLSDLAGIEALTSIEKIDLRSNFLTDPMEISRLTHSPKVQQIFVAKNPMIRMYASYRTTIFNLFRGASSYEQDIVIDSSGPLYHEKKQLKDRARCSVQDIERIFELSGASSQTPNTRTISFSISPCADRVPPTAENQQTLRKTARRRIVEISSEDLSASPPSDILLAAPRAQSVPTLQLPNSTTFDTSIDSMPGAAYIPCNSVQSIWPSSTLSTMAKDHTSDYQLSEEASSGGTEAQSDYQHQGVGLAQTLDSRCVVDEAWLSSLNHDRYMHDAGVSHPTNGRIQAVGGVH